MRIEVISDTVCPWCFIGKRRLEQALAMRDPGAVEIVWRPFQLNPAMPAGGMERERYLIAKFGGAERAERQYERIRAAGRDEGIEFRFDLIRHVPNSVQSHRLLRLAERAGTQGAVAEALFAAYFLHGRNIGLNDELVEIARAAGMDTDRTRAYLASDEDRAQILAEDERARLNNINGVPCFVIEGQYAVSGAQSPEIFLQLFDVVREERLAAQGHALAGVRREAATPPDRGGLPGTRGLFP